MENSSLKYNSVCTFFVGEKMNEKIIKLLIKLNKKAIKNGDVPVSCVITKNGTIISKAFNRKVLKNDPLAHAEIIAIRKAAKKLKTYNLNDCEIYVTLYPCDMCYNVINEARIKNVYYILDRKKYAKSTIKSKQVFEKNQGYFEEEIKSFFVDKR